MGRIPEISEVPNGRGDSEGTISHLNSVPDLSWVGQEPEGNALSRKLIHLCIKTVEGRWKPRHLLSRETD